MAVEAILRKTKLLSQRKSFQDITVLFSGKFVVQLLALVSQPILARLYTPAQFGEFALLNSLLAILLVASCGRYEAGIVLTKNKAQSRRLFQVSQSVLFVYVLLVASLVFIYYYFFRDSLTTYKLPVHALCMIPLLVWCGGYWRIVQNWLIRFQNYAKLSYGQVIERLIFITCALIFSFLPFSGNGLVNGVMVAMLLVFGMAFYHQRHRIAMPTKIFRAYAFHFRDFPLYSVPTAILILVIQHLPVFWISIFYNTSMTGNYSMAYSVIMVPITVLSMSAGQVFHERLAQKHPSERISFIQKMLLIYAPVLLAIWFLLWIGGEFIVTYFFGENWQKAGAIVSCLSPVIFCQGIIGIFTQALNVFRKQQWIMGGFMIQLLFLIAALIIGYQSDNILLSFRLISLFSFIHLIIATVFFLRLIFQKQK